MSEYDIQAKEFLRRANATMTITYIDRRKNTDWGDTFERPFFRVNITTPLGLYGFFFWGAVMDETVSEYDVLSCLENMITALLITFATNLAMTTTASRHTELTKNA